MRVRKWQSHVHDWADCLASGKLQQRTWGRLYLDQRAALDSITCEYLVANSTCDVRMMQSSLKALNITDEVREQIIEEAIIERKLIRRTGASSQLGVLVSDMHTATWLMCTNQMPDNDDSVVWRKRSSRQRCLLGGIAFNLMYEQVFRKVRAAGHQEPPSAVALERVPRGQSTHRSEHSA